MNFKPYTAEYYQACLDIFDANCPEFFAPNERGEYEAFLSAVADGYEVCEVDGRVRGAFGVLDSDEPGKRLNWIMLDPQTQGMGLGGKIMERVIQLATASGAAEIRIAASHKSAPFFARFGAIILSTTQDGWGVGMDRIDMVLRM